MSGSNRLVKEYLSNKMSGSNSLIVKGSFRNKMSDSNRLERKMSSTN